LHLAREVDVEALLVEHDVPFVFRVWDRIMALDFGSKIAEETPAEISLSRAVITACLGKKEMASSTFNGRAGRLSIQVGEIASHRAEIGVWEC
jgi:ABC-type sulfate/molybdate transport systems ATPase subunit